MNPIQSRGPHAGGALSQPRRNDASQDGRETKEVSRPFSGVDEITRNLGATHLNASNSRCLPDSGSITEASLSCRSSSGAKAPNSSRSERSALCNGAIDRISSGNCRLNAPEKGARGPSSSGGAPQKVKVVIPSRPNPHPIKKINGHDDDIHGFALISPERFVSGSKDNTLKMWDIEGNFLERLIPQFAQKEAHRGYRYWITALTRLSDYTWASATRDGFISFWDVDGNELYSTSYTPSQAVVDQTICKDRNKSRINCMVPVLNEEPGRYLYAGSPRFLHQWDTQTQQLISSDQASANDWVYCIEVLENQDLLVVIGSDLEHWNMNSAERERSPLIREEVFDRRRGQKSRQRPHISAITRLESNRALLASALFDGSVKVVDIERRSLVKKYEEHVGRVWSVINMTDTTFATSADDRTIKIWDVRQQNSVSTILAGSGRVSSLLKISPEVFISGSCPDNPHASREKGSISFWDIRKI